MYVSFSSSFPITHKVRFFGRQRQRWLERRRLRVCNLPQHVFNICIVRAVTDRCHHRRLVSQPRPCRCSAARRARVIKQVQGWNPSAVARRKVRPRSHRRRARRAVRRECLHNEPPPLAHRHTSTPQPPTNAAAAEVALRDSSSTSRCLRQGSRRKSRRRTRRI